MSPSLPSLINWHFFVILIDTVAQAGEKPETEQGCLSPLPENKLLATWAEVC